jgi:hypothetical protein
VLGDIVASRSRSIPFHAFNYANTAEILTFIASLDRKRHSQDHGAMRSSEWETICTPHLALPREKDFQSKRSITQESDFAVHRRSPLLVCLPLVKNVVPNFSGRRTSRCLPPVSREKLRRRKLGYHAGSILSRWWSSDRVLGGNENLGARRDMGAVDIGGSAVVKRSSDCGTPHYSVDWRCGAWRWGLRFAGRDDRCERSVKVGGDGKRW